MHPRSGHISGTYKDNKGKIDVKLPLITFKEDDCHIVYCPALDVSGYGNTEQEASESFTVSLGSFFSYSNNKGTFEGELKRLGWKVMSSHKRMTPPDMTKLLSENDNFSRIFNNHDFNKFERKIEIPVY